MRNFLLSSASAAILSVGAFTVPALADSPSLQAHQPGQIQLAEATDGTVMPEGEINTDINASEDVTSDPTSDAPAEGLTTESDPVSDPAAPDTSVTETLDAPAESLDEAAEAEEVDPSEIPTGQLAAEPVQPPGTVLADELLSADVIDVNGEEVASVYEVLVGTDGQITHVVVSYGGFIGIGTKEVLIPWENVSYNAAQATLQIPATEADLDAAPSFMTQDEFTRQQEAERAADAPAPTGVPQQAETPPESQSID